jgi:hypothetical protein
MEGRECEGVSRSLFPGARLEIKLGLAESLRNQRLRRNMTPSELARAINPASRGLRKWKPAKAPFPWTFAIYLLRRALSRSGRCWAGTRCDESCALEGRQKTQDARLPPFQGGWTLRSSPGSLRSPGAMSFRPSGALEACGLSVRAMTSGARQNKRSKWHWVKSVGLAHDGRLR